MNKPRIFLNVGTYLPGYRGGGPTQSVKNLVEALSNEFEFYIYTANHDLGIKKNYEKVKTDQWGNYDGINIFYSSEKNKSNKLKKILKKNEYSLVFLNSFFSIDTIRILILRKQLKLKTPVVLMPRGELSKGALSIKKTKKMIYLHVAKTIGLLDQINYLSTALDEYNQIHKILKTKRIIEVSNVPNAEKKVALNTKEEDKLKVVFLSRITQKKNLDYALKTLKNCKGNIEFDIYGTLEELKYWEKCKKIIDTLPNNITVTYKGELSNNKVITTLSKYDLFYFPTKSENYGHVISEALQASIPVLISDQTPWKNLEEKKLGWEFSLETNDFFSEKIDELSLLGTNEYNIWKETIYSNFDIQTRVNIESAKYIEVFNHLITENE